MKTMLATVTTTKPCAMAMCVLFALGLWSPALLAAPAKGQKGHSKASKPRKTDQPKKRKRRKDRHAGEKRETIILPIRYTRGSRMVRLLKMFVPFNAHHRVMLRYSPSLHKILIRAPKPILESLVQAAKKLDVPQTQFRVEFYFVSSAKGDKAKAFQASHPGLHGYLKKAYPMKQGFGLAGFAYVRASNHAEAELKITGRDRVGAPSAKIVLHQAPSAKALIAMRLKIAQHERFTATKRGNPHVMFISSVQLSTKLFVTPGQFTLAGHTPFHRIRSKARRALVIVRISRLP